MCDVLEIFYEKFRDELLYDCLVLGEGYGNIEEFVKIIKEYNILLRVIGVEVIFDFLIFKGLFIVVEIVFNVIKKVLDKVWFEVFLK